MFTGTALSVCLLVYAGLSLFIISGLTCMWLYAYFTRITLHWSVVILPTQAAKVSMASAAFCCDVATLAKGPEVPPWSLHRPRSWIPQRDH